MTTDVVPGLLRLVQFTFLLFILKLLLSSTVIAQEAAFNEEQFRKYVGQLGDSSFAVREEAKRQLIAMGKPALDRLRQVSKDPNLEGLADPRDPEVVRNIRNTIMDLHDKIPAGKTIDKESMDELRERSNSVDERYTMHRREEQTPLGPLRELQQAESVFRQAFPFAPNTIVLPAISYEYDEQGKLKRIDFTVQDPSNPNRRYRVVFDVEEGEPDANNHSEVRLKRLVSIQQETPELPLSLLSLMSSTSVMCAMFQMRWRRRLACIDKLRAYNPGSRPSNPIPFS